MMTSSEIQWVFGLAYLYGDSHIAASGGLQRHAFEIVMLRMTRASQQVRQGVPE